MRNGVGINIQLGSYGQFPCAVCLVQLSSAPPGPSWLPGVYQGLAAGRQAEPGDFLICCVITEAGRRGDNACAGIPLQSCLFLGERHHDLKRTQCFHLLRSIRERLAVCKHWMWNEKKNAMILLQDGGLDKKNNNKETK